MLEFSEISINDKPIFDKYLKSNYSHVSELTFTNLFMWRNYYKICFSVYKEYLCILAMPENKEPFCFMPAGAQDREALGEVIIDLKNYFDKKGWQLVFKRIGEAQLPLLEGIGSVNLRIEADRDNSDYIYTAKDLIELKGKKYDGKRNHINKFTKSYEYCYHKLEESHIGECFRIMDEWCAERSCEEHREFYCEKKANTELLSNFSMLGCKGAIISVDGRMEGFTVGEMLNEDTAVIHIEKANSKINGLYTFINQQFCMQEWKDALYINREQDLGREGLRKAKLSYHPYMIINKYNVALS